MPSDSAALHPAATGSPSSDVGHGRGAGLAAGLGAYAIWGLMPVYFHALGSVPLLQVVAHRIVWSALLLLVVLALRNRLAELVRTLVTPRLILPLSLSALLIAVNWLLYIWAVQQHQIVAASLGYFLNPLLNVLLGFAVLGERLQRAQWMAVGLAAAGVAILAAGALSTLWISLGLALSFGVYGLVRKTAQSGPLVGLAAETVVLLPLALGAFAWWQSAGTLMLSGESRWTMPLLAFAGVITAVPLLLFSFAARRLRLATLGLLQYVGPTLQLLLGLFLYGEHLTAAHSLAFPLIWAALALYSWSAWRAARAGASIRD